MTKQCHHISTKERDILLDFLGKFEDTFDGTLGMWNTTPVYLGLKNDSKLVCSRPYQVLKVHKAVFKKGDEQLVSLGVLKQKN